MDRASAIKTVDTGSIPGRVKPKTIKIGIHNFPAWRTSIKRRKCDLQYVWKTGGNLSRRPKGPFPGLGYSVNKDVITITYKQSLSSSEKLKVLCKVFSKSAIIFKNYLYREAKKKENKITLHDFICHGVAYSQFYNTMLGNNESIKFCQKSFSAVCLKWLRINKSINTTTRQKFHELNWKFTWVHYCKTANYGNVAQMKMIEGILHQ